MKKLFALLMAVCITVPISACSPRNDEDTEESTPALINNSEPTAAADVSDDTAVETIASDGSDILVAYFSRTGEQYGVGVIEEGNTAVIAGMISEETGADTFEILPEDDYYPTTYDELTKVAQQEQSENVRPAISDEIANFSDYDTIFIGYPIWWGDMPMIVYTFLESYDFDGKTVIPFCTHAGSGLSGTQSTIEDILNGTAVEDGLAIPGTTAQNERDSARASVENWLTGLGF